MRYYQTIEAFYAEDPARAHSGEVDFGVMWSTSPDGSWPCYRISWVERTGEFYALRLAGTDEGYGPRVEVLGRVPTREAADRTLEGWAETPGKSLGWARVRIDEDHEPAPVAATADRVEVESDENGWELAIVDDEGREYRFNVHGVALALAESRGFRALAEWAAEGAQIRKEVARSRLTYLCAIGEHEECVQQGRECECDCHTLPLSDPKNPRHAEAVLEATDFDEAG